MDEISAKISLLEKNIKEMMGCSLQNLTLIKLLKENKNIDHIVSNNEIPHEIIEKILYLDMIRNYDFSHPNGNEELIKILLFINNNGWILLEIIKDKVIFAYSIFDLINNFVAMISSKENIYLTFTSIMNIFNYLFGKEILLSTINPLWFIGLMRTSLFSYLFNDPYILNMFDFSLLIKEFKLIVPYQYLSLFEEIDESIKNKSFKYQNGINKHILFSYFIFYYPEDYVINHLIETNFHIEIDNIDEYIYHIKGFFSDNINLTCIKYSIETNLDIRNEKDAKNYRIYKAIYDNQ